VFRRINVKNLNVPEQVNRYVQTISAADLIPILSLTYPAVARATDSNVVVRLLKHKYIKVENSEYKNRFSDNANEATRYLYDLTDVLIKTALKRGGLETNFQATLASNELGRLRDEKFIIPILKSGNFEERLTAVACLAFLQTSNSIKILRRIMFEDSDPEVRKSATWGYAFAKQSKSTVVTEKFMTDENNENASNSHYGVSHLISII
jgi:hypothetical protein